MSAGIWCDVSAGIWFIHSSDRSGDTFRQLLAKLVTKIGATLRHILYDLLGIV